MKNKLIPPFSPFVALVLGLLLFLGGAAGAGEQAPPAKKKPVVRPVVLLDKETQAPRLIRGMEEYIPGAEGGGLQVSPTNIERLAVDYFKKNETRLTLKTADLKLGKVRKVGRFWIAAFRQHYKGVPVFRSRIGLIALGDGKVISIGSNFDSKINLDIAPKVTFDNIVATAAGSMKLKDPGAVRTYLKELVVYRNPPRSQPRHSLAWFFVLESKKPNAYVHKFCLLDAHSGRVIRIENALRDATLKAQVRGEVWLTDPTRSAVSKPLPNLFVEVQEKRQFTGPNGHFQLEGLGAGSYDLNLRLEGTYVVVYHNSNTGADDFIDNEQKLQGTVATGSEGRFDWPSSDEVNAYYHITRIRNWYHDVFGYDWECWFDREAATRRQIIVACNSGPEFNGMACMGGVWLGSESGRQWARSADVIYHEFTHNVITAIFDGNIISRSDKSEGYTMDEGFSDYFACALNDDPLLGENVMPSPRNLVNNAQYPSGPYSLEGHAGAPIIAGALWDFRCSIDKAEADQLVFQALNIMSAWPPEYYFSNPEESNFLSALRLAAGDQHGREIDQAFANHGLLPQADLVPRVKTIDPAAETRAIGPDKIVITFNRDINERTLSGNVIVEREDFQGRRTVECSLSLDPETKRTLTIKPTSGSGGFSPMGTQTNFYVRLISGAGRAVLDTDSQRLDGDGDGQPGGDYKVKFWVID
jgi:Zn-dependent metalloprotease